MTLFVKVVSVRPRANSTFTHFVGPFTLRKRAEEALISIVRKRNVEHAEIVHKPVEKEKH
jgi:hypothetical protein